MIRRGLITMLLVIFMGTVVAGGASAAKAPPRHATNGKPLGTLRCQVRAHRRVCVKPKRSAGAKTHARKAVHVAGPVAAMPGAPKIAGSIGLALSAAELFAPAGGLAPRVPGAPRLSEPAGAPVPAATATRLQATSREFSLQLSRPSVAAGALILELVNMGEDQHDLHVRPASGGADLLSADLTDPSGGVTDVDGALESGSYILYCALPGHEAAGMQATLQVP